MEFITRPIEQRLWRKGHNLTPASPVLVAARFELLHNVFGSHGGRDPNSGAGKNRQAEFSQKNVVWCRPMSPGVVACRIHISPNAVAKKTHVIIVA